jgi:hypothetical protein
MACSAVTQLAAQKTGGSAQLGSFDAVPVGSNGAEIMGVVKIPSTLSGTQYTETGVFGGQ